MNHKSSIAEETVPVSIVVCARNEEQNLKELIPTLVNQNYSDYEIIIVLDRCVDESLSLLKRFENEIPNLKTVIVDFLPDHFSPKKYGLTLGIKAAKNDWVLLTDADCLPNKNWIQSMATNMNANSDFVLGLGPLSKKKTLLNGFIQYETFLTAYNYLTAAMSGNPYMGVGRNLAYRKSVFLGAQGFNKFQHVMGGDDDLFVQYQAIGNRTQINIQSTAQVTSTAKGTFKDYWVQKKRHLSISKFYKTPVKITHSINSMMTWMTWILFAIGAFFLDPLFILLMISAYFLFKTTLHWIVSRKIRMSYSFWLAPAFEGFYITFVPVVLMANKFSKKVKWK